MKVVLPTDNSNNSKNNNNLLPHRYSPRDILSVLRRAVPVPLPLFSSLFFYQQQKCVAITHGPKQICNSSDGNSIEH